MHSNLPISSQAWLSSITGTNPSTRNWTSSITRWKGLLVLGKNNPEYSNLHSQARTRGSKPLLPLMAISSVGRQLWADLGPHSSLLLAGASHSIRQVLKSILRWQVGTGTTNSREGWNPLNVQLPSGGPLLFLEGLPHTQMKLPITSNSLQNCPAKARCLLHRTGCPIQSPLNN